MHSPLHKDFAPKEEMNFTMNAYDRNTKTLPRGNCSVDKTMFKIRRWVLQRFRTNGLPKNDSLCEFTKHLVIDL